MYHKLKGFCNNLISLYNTKIVRWALVYLYASSTTGIGSVCFVYIRSITFHCTSCYFVSHLFTQPLPNRWKQTSICLHLCYLHFSWPISHVPLERQPVSHHGSWKQNLSFMLMLFFKANTIFGGLKQFIASINLKLPVFTSPPHVQWWQIHYYLYIKQNGIIKWSKNYIADFYRPSSSCSELGDFSYNSTLTDIELSTVIVPVLPKHLFLAMHVSGYVAAVLGPREVYTLAFIQTSSESSRMVLHTVG